VNGLRTGAIVVAIWTADALTYILQQLLYYAASDQEAPLRDLYYSSFKTAGTWCVITLALIGLRVVPRLRNRPLPVVLVVHLALALVGSGVEVGSDLLLGRMTGILPIVGSIAASFFRQSTFNSIT